MPKLSVCIICKNEENKIEACLNSVKWADEIIIVDSGSTDNTLRIARKYTDKVFEHIDWSGFGSQKRRAEDYATNDWVLSIDSDEIISEALQKEVLEELVNIKDNEVLVLNRLTHFCGQFVRHSGWHPDPLVRIYNKTQYRFNKNLVHESVSCKGSVKKNLKNKLLHYTFDNLVSYLAKRNGYAEIWAKERFQEGKKASVIKALSSSVFSFIRHYILRLGILDGKVGLLISIIQMQYSFNKYMMLLMMNNNKH